MRISNLYSGKNFKTISLNKYFYTLLILTLILGLFSVTAYSKYKKGKKGEATHITVLVLDKKDSQPLQLVNVMLERENTIMAGAVTKPSGKAYFTDIAVGSYKLVTYYVGYETYSKTVTIDKTHNNFKVLIGEKSVELGQVVVSGSNTPRVTTSIDAVTGRQVFEGETYHASPTAQMTTLIQQNLAGAVKAPTGEVHIRGQHGEFTYLIDGVPIPLGVFGGLNEIVDPKIISRVTFYTGGFPAEYGGQIAGLMDVQTRVPSGSFHLDFSSFLGSYFTSEDGAAGKKVGKFKSLNSNGQSLSLSNHAGKLGYFISASRQETDRRIDQPVQQLFHDHGFDYFLFGKVDYLLNENDYITGNFNFSKTQSQVPYDPAEGFAADDQLTYNAFQTISYYHTISTEADNESSLFIGALAREGGLRYLPNVNDSQSAFYGNDTTTSYQIDQKRTFTTLGLRAKYDHRLTHRFKYAAGFDFSNTSGKDNFRFFNTSGDGPKVSSDFNGYDLGLFIQSEIHPTEWTKFELGLRYDVHNAPGIQNQKQLSPRTKVSFLVDEYNTISLSYDRLFMPTNIENLGTLASQLGNSALPAIPEKDNLFEISFIRNWKNGFNSKMSVFYKESSPGLDDETLGSSTVRVNVNINKIKVKGIELALTYHKLNSPFSGFINSSVIHAYGTGPVSGGFLPADPGTAPFDLDHDQRLSAVIGLNYQPETYFVNLTGTYGSGLANGNDNYSYKTGLFDFNQGAHTTPSWIFDFSAGYKFYLGNGHSIEPSVYITNVFDHNHLIKGAYFSGASFEARRNVVFKLTYHI